MKFYKKEDNTSILDSLTNQIKLNLNWNLVKNGANVNEVFKKNPVGLDAFLKEEVKTKIANKFDYVIERDSERGRVAD